MALESGKTPVKELPLWERYADQFPVRERFTYLNHAAVAPLSKRAARAMQDLAGDCLEFGSFHYDEWLAVYEGLRAAAARLVGAERSEIAIVKNTSEGIATVAIGLDWKAGDRVVGFREEFPANYFPWKRLEQRGVAMTWLSIHDSLDRIDEACRGARLLAVSFVQYMGGYRAPLEVIGEICQRNRCIFL
ncbi:MAG TPA: aminotransferase class V-fold PLP-dependent enzyme, partial [Bryobacteraceae bacterium]|nr:aminotransferase class V-fold PLP-dependent enzyme [Bryobacteraceae bacterium]